MKTTVNLALMLTLPLILIGTTLRVEARSGAEASVHPARPEGPCDIYASGGTPCVAAHSTTRALYASYHGPLYRILRQSDGKTLDIGVVEPVGSPSPDGGGYADAAAQDTFCANTYCWISTIYDQSPKHNDLTQAPRGAFSGPAMGGFNNLPIADMAPVTIMGHKAYGVFIMPGMGLRRNDARGTAVDDQAQGQYWVINGLRYDRECCFDYGNAEIDSRDDDNGTMETANYSNATGWYHGIPPGPWIMTDQENNLVGCVNPDGSTYCANLPTVKWRFLTAIAKGESHHWTTLGGDAQRGTLSVMFNGPRVDSTYDPMRKQGGIVLGNGGDNSDRSQGTFYEGAMTAGGTFPTDATDRLVQANIVAARYDVQRLSLMPSSTSATPPSLRIFLPGSSQEITVTFTNTTDAPVVSLRIPAGTRLAARGSYLLGLANSGLAVPARAGDRTIHVRDTTGMLKGDGIDIDTGSEIETRKIASIGTAASTNTTLWQPLPDGPVIIIPVGSINVPVMSVSGFAAGQKIAIGYGATYPAVANTRERYEVATVTGVGKPGTQAYLGMDAAARATNIKVTSVSDISVGDKIRLDIDSNDHGIETVTITKVGTQANRTTLSAGASVGSTKIHVSSMNGFAVGDKPTVGTPANREIVSITGVGTRGPTGTGIDFVPALARAHTNHEMVVAPGTGLDLATPLRFNHAANLPFSDRGTGISFQPAAAFAHSSNEPVQGLGTGIVLDSPLTKDHVIDAVVRDAKVTSAGYQGTLAPNQWFGGPVLFAGDGVFEGRIISIQAGSMVLRDASGLAVDSLNYGLPVDPWAQGGHASSGMAQGGSCMIAPAEGISAAE